MKPAPAIIGIDTGGTFTDLIAFVGGELRTHKVLSTPHDPARAVLRGLRELLPEARPRLHHLRVDGGHQCVAGTARRAGRPADDGGVRRRHRDRPAESAAAVRARAAPSAAAGAARAPHRRRRAHAVRRPRAASAHAVRALRAALRAVRRHRPDAVAVCLLHSYANPAHERLLGRALAAARRSSSTRCRTSWSRSIASTSGSARRSSTPTSGRS